MGEYVNKLKYSPNKPSKSITAMRLNVINHVCNAWKKKDNAGRTSQNNKVVICINCSGRIYL